MKKYAPTIFIALLLALGMALYDARAQNVGGGSGTITTLDQFTSTTSPSTAITQRSYGKAFRLSGQTTGCAQFSSIGVITSTLVACGSGSGGSNSKWATSTDSSNTIVPNTATGVRILLASSTALSSLDGLFAGRTATTSIYGNNATSTFAGGIASVNAGGVSSTNGVTITGGDLKHTGLTSAITLTDAAGNFGEYAGVTCTNQFLRALSALGASTCATVGSADVSLANLTATDSTLTFSGTYTGATARTIGLNLGNANAWTVLQTFTLGASSSLSFSSNNGLFTGRSATTSIVGDNATSTFSGGISSLGTGGGLASNHGLTITGGRIIGTGLSTSTLSQGIDITDGCFSIDDVCISGGAGGGTVTSITAGNQLLGGTITTSGTIAVTSTPTFYRASTTLLSASSTIYVGTTATTTIVGNNATSTFAGGIASVNAGGLSSTNGLTLSGGRLIATGVSTSSFSQGINLTAGCFAINDSCVGNSAGGGSGTVNSGTAGQIAYYASAGTTVSGTSNVFVFDAKKTIGIGTSTPYSLLTIWGTSTIATDKALEVVDSASSTLLSITNSGIVSIGTSTATTTGVGTIPGIGQRLDVNGSINISKFSAYKQDGSPLLYASSTNRSTILGFGAGGSLSTTSSAVLGNTIVGALAGQGLVGATSIDNVLIGVQAGRQINGASGVANIAIGNRAGDDLVNHGSNIMIGHLAADGMSSSNNIVIGRQAGGAGLSAGKNIILGYLSFTDAGASSGGSNIFIGQSINPVGDPTGQLNIGNVVWGSGMYSGASPSNVPVIDSRIGIGTTTPAALFAIGAQRTGTTKNLFLVASSTPTATPTGTTTLMVVTNAGFTGIGTTTPGALFSVAATSSQSAPIVLISTSSPAYSVEHVGTSTAFMIDSTGKVGIATSSPWRSLSLVGTMAINGLTVATNKNAVCLDASTKEVVDSGNVTCALSSKYLKHDISTITSEQGRKILSVRPVLYTENDGGERRPGFIAEELDAIDPLLAEHADVDTTIQGHLFKKGDPISANYTSGWAFVVKFVQDLYRDMQGVIAKLSGLEKRVDEQQKQIDALRAEIERIKK